MGGNTQPCHLALQHRRSIQTRTRGAANNNNGEVTVRPAPQQLGCGINENIGGFQLLNTPHEGNNLVLLRQPQLATRRLRRPWAAWRKQTEVRTWRNNVNTLGSCPQ